jgi:hypothetical protein
MLYLEWKLLIHIFFFSKPDAEPPEVLPDEVFKIPEFTSLNLTTRTTRFGKPSHPSIKNNPLIIAP